jgi:RNA polymerase sigma-70 factor (ECF subfamily)
VGTQRRRRPGRLLAEDAALTMPPIPTWYRGREVIAEFLRERPFADRYRWHVVPTRANGQPAFAHYRWLDEEQAYVARELVVLTLDGDTIRELTIFRDPKRLERFGFPRHYMEETR